MSFSIPAHSGFGDRLLSEVKKLAPKDVKIRVGARGGLGWAGLGLWGSEAPHGVASLPAWLHRCCRLAPTSTLTPTSAGVPVFTQGGQL